MGSEIREMRSIGLGNVFVVVLHFLTKLTLYILHRDARAAKNQCKFLRSQGSIQETQHGSARYICLQIGVKRSVGFEPSEMLLLLLWSLSLTLPPSQGNLSSLRNVTSGWLQCCLNFSYHCWQYSCLQDFWHQWGRRSISNCSLFSTSAMPPPQSMIPSGKIWSGYKVLHKHLIPTLLLYSSKSLTGSWHKLRKPWRTLQIVAKKLIRIRTSASQVAGYGSQIPSSRRIKVYSQLLLITGQSSGGVCYLLMIKTPFLNSTMILWCQKISIAWRAVLTYSEQILSFWGESKKNAVQVDLTVRYQPTLKKETTMWTQATVLLLHFPIHYGCLFPWTLIWTV